jgi:hypothetical protein
MKYYGDITATWRHEIHDGDMATWRHEIHERHEIHDGDMAT